MAGNKSFLVVRQHVAMAMCRACGINSPLRSFSMRSRRFADVVPRNKWAELLGVFINVGPFARARCRSLTAFINGAILRTGLHAGWVLPVEIYGAESEEARFNIWRT